MNIGEQTAIESMAVGDPHDVIVVDEKSFAVANYVAGTIALVNTKDGFPGSTLSTNLTPRGGATLKPSSVFSFKHPDTDEMLLGAIHESGAFVDQKFIVNDSSTLFIFENIKDEWTAIDTDETTVGIQGVALAGSFPVFLSQNGSDGTLNFASLCSTLIDPSSPSPCVAAFEIVALSDEKWSAQNLWDISQERPELKMNGSIVGTNSSGEFAASVTDTGANTNEVTLFNPNRKTTRTLYVYPAGSMGFWGMFFDRSSGRLFVGHETSDPNSNDGEFAVFFGDRFTETKDIELPGVPYSGALLPF